MLFFGKKKKEKGYQKLCGCIPSWEGKKRVLRPTEAIFLGQIQCFVTGLEKNERENISQKFETVRSFMDLKKRDFKKSVSKRTDIHCILKNQLLLA